MDFQPITLYMVGVKFLISGGGAVQPLPPVARPMRYASHYPGDTLSPAVGLEEYFEAEG